MTQAALVYAERLHDGQLRAVDGAPFLAHPVEVASLLYDSGARDDVVAAGLLHDTLEKTDADAYELSARFGRRVGEIVRALTEDQRIAGYARRKAALRDQLAHSDHDALNVFAADKISKVRELQVADMAGSPVSHRRRKLTHYRRSLAMLQERIPESALVARLS